MTVLWTFVAYSFLGFVLECLFARAIGHPKRDRKCFYLLPLCPVYGLGALAILALPEPVARDPFLLWLLGGAVAAGVEYLMGLFYEKTLGVAFWDYSDYRWNLGGKVCPAFAVAWGGLAVALRWWLHPLLEPWLAAIPESWGGWMVAALTLDSYVTLALLSHTGDVSRMRWYDAFRAPSARRGYPPPSGEEGSPPPER